MQKILIQDNGQKFVRLSLKSAIIAVLIILIGIFSILYVFYRASNLAYNSFQQWRDKHSLLITSPLTKIKDIFQFEKTATQTVRLVNEESQIIDVVKKASPAVVSIIASAEVPKLEKCNIEDDWYDSNIPSQFKGFFNFPSSYICQKGTEVVRVGAGTGFIVSNDGYIITNSHVVDDTKAEYTVVLNDSKNLEKKTKAKVLARDATNDVAVLKVEMSNLPYLSFGDSSKLQVGQTAIAIGYALGKFDNTVTKGVVSGLSRSISAYGSKSGVETLRGLIQTDAAINPGNSGGPLLDINGNVIGINVAVAQAQSIGFAVPSNIVKNAFEQVKTTGKISEKKKPYLGVRYVAITDELKANKKLSYNYGMLIVNGGNNEQAVISGSPASKAGIKEGDIILELNGKQLNERYLLSDAVGEYKVGDEVALKVDSGGMTKIAKVKLEEKK